MMKRKWLMTVVCFGLALGLANASEITITFDGIADGDDPGAQSYGSVAGVVDVDYNISGSGTDFLGYVGYYANPGAANGVIYNTGASGIGSIRFTALVAGEEVRLDDLTLAGYTGGTVSSDNGALSYSYNASDWFAIDTGNIPGNSYDTVSLVGSGSSVIQGSDVYLQWQDDTGNGEAGFALDDVRFNVIPEPGTFGLLAVAAVVALIRRRRMSR